MDKILVVGGTGFIGSHICKCLTDGGHTVFAYDSQFNYLREPVNAYSENMAYRFEHLLNDTTVIRGDTRNPWELRRAFMRVQPDQVIHLAALPLADVAIEKSEEAFDSIVAGTVNLLEILRDEPPIKRFTFISSSMVYGDFVRTPAQEGMEKRPKDIYGSMKLAAEVIVRGYAQRYGIPITIVRPSAVYGPTDQNRRVLAIFIEKAMAGQEITITNGGRTALDFTFVEDVAKGICLATTSPMTLNETLNVTRGEGRSLLDAVGILKQYFPDLRYRVEHNETFHPLRGALDISKARDLAGYEPRYSLEDGLARYLDHLGVPQALPMVGAYT